MATKKNTVVAVIAGGISPEREISLRSGRSVEQALHTAGYTTLYIDYTHPTDIKNVTADVFFPVLHGTGGEDGDFAVACEQYGYKHVGSDQAASKLCFNKPEYLTKIAQHGFLTPQGQDVDELAFESSVLSTQPFVLKPGDGGSSIDTFIIRDPSSIPRAEIYEAFQRHPTLLLEPLIDGIELTVGVLDDEALSVIEIVPPLDGEFDYENKYNGKTQELCPPQNISVSTQLQAQQIAKEIHTVTGCRHYSRTDMILQPDGKLIVLETNTLPGMTSESLFPKAAAQAGMPFPVLVDRLVTLALMN
jgi:D-alanine-D-alanine ligase